jgi:hypothetical protein
MSLCFPLTQGAWNVPDHCQFSGRWQLAILRGPCVMMMSHDRLLFRNSPVKWSLWLLVPLPPDTCFLQKRTWCTHRRRLLYSRMLFIMSVGVMKDYKLKLRNLLSSHTRVEYWHLDWKKQVRESRTSESTRSDGLIGKMKKTSSSWCGWNTAKTRKADCEKTGLRTPCSSAFFPPHTKRLLCLLIYARTGFEPSRASLPRPPPHYSYFVYTIEFVVYLYVLWNNPGISRSHSVTRHKFPFVHVRYVCVQRYVESI